MIDSSQVRLASRWHQNKMAALVSGYLVPFSRVFFLSALFGTLMAQYLHLLVTSGTA